MAKNFKDTVMYKKGVIGERIFDDYIQGRGNYYIYQAAFDGSHPFDRLLVHKQTGKMIVADIKTVDSRNSYPDTGVSIRHYETYKRFEVDHNTMVWLVFVDASEGRVYGNTLANLDSPTTIIHNGRLVEYPIRKSNFSAAGGSIIFFPLANMVDLIALTDEQVNEIQEHKNQGYQQDVSHKPGYDEWQQRRQERRS